jgi:hypothetical protein
LIRREGVLKLALSGGSQAVLEAPINMAFESRDRWKLEAGTVAIGGPQGKSAGILLETPFAVIREVGTSFAVRVEEQSAEVHVFDGEVEVFPEAKNRREPGSLNGLRSKTPPTDFRNPPGRTSTEEIPEGNPVRLLQGEAVRLLQRAGGWFLERLPAEAGRFLRPEASPVCVPRWRQAVLQQPELRHLWSFEGWQRQQVLRDHKGHLDLKEVVMFGGAGGGKALYFQPGASSLSRSVVPFRAETAGNSLGAAFQSTEVFVPSESLTVQAICRFDGLSHPQPEDVCILLGTRAGADRCGFLLAADGFGRLLCLFEANSPWLEIPVRLLPGGWYYLAATFENRENQGRPGSRVTVFVGELDGPSSLTKVVDGVWIPGQLPGGFLGVGKGFEKNGAHAYPWPGAIDELAVFSSALEEVTIRKHFGLLVGSQVVIAAP